MANGGWRVLRLAHGLRRVQQICRRFLLILCPSVAHALIVSGSLPHRQDTSQDPSGTQTTVRLAAAIRSLRFGT